jgi:adenosylcobinamide-GDP ribazoletransferase
VIAALRGARLAVTFLTRLPVGGFPYSEQEAKWASAWFPAVGLALGLLYFAVFSLSRGAGDGVAAVLAIATALFVTGAFHEDGLADSADALGGAVERARIFEILKDSRIGTYGAAALFVALALRVGLLVRLADEANGANVAFWALLISESLSRACAVWLMVAMRYATSDAHSKSRQMTRAGLAQGALASAWPLLALIAAVVCGYLQLFQAMWLSAGALGMAAWLGWRFLRRAGGVTGDFLGATQQLCAITVLLIWALSLPS